jgi:hypothetical protein
MALEHAQSLAAVTIAFANGAVSAVTASRNHFITDDGKPVPGSGRYEDTPVPLDDPALAALLGEVNTALAARVADLEAQLAAAEAE